LFLAASTHLSHYGYWGVALVVGAESLGVPVPGEAALIAAAAYAGEKYKLNPWVIFVVAAVAAVAGNGAGYLIGRLGGFRLALRYGRKVRLDERKLKVGRYVFDTQGTKVVFFGRFVSVLRTYVAFLAGTVEMRWDIFTATSAVAASAWSGLYTALAYNSSSFLNRVSTSFDVAVGLLAAAAVIGGYFFLRSHYRRLEERAEAAYPGPLEGHLG
jgi:membrane protein DedA with SNARE-associated domain